MTPDPWQALLPGTTDLPAARLEAYAAELRRWNRAVRLVGPRDLTGIRLQIADALAPFLLVPPPFPLLDIGSGAGLPALPLALAFPTQDVVCLEPLGKRVSFLRHAVRTLGLGRVRVVQGRSEDALRLHPELAQAFAAVTARAVADAAALLREIRRFLRPDGRAFLPRGAESPAQAPGWELDRDLAYPPLPGLGPRRLQIYRLAA